MVPYDALGDGVQEIVGLSRLYERCDMPVQRDDGLVEFTSDGQVRVILVLLLKRVHSVGDHEVREVGT